MALQSIVAGAGLLCGSAFADQTDPQLDPLFDELRFANADDVPGIEGKIRTIWLNAASDTVDILVVRAIESIDKRDVVVASALLDHVVGLAPNFAQGYTLRGLVRTQMSDQAGAAEDFLKAIELEPRHFEARLALAEIYRTEGDKVGAYDLIQEALAWSPLNELALSRARLLREQIDGQEI